MAGPNTVPAPTKEAGVHGPQLAPGAQRQVRGGPDADLFLVAVLAEALGVPSPASFYAAELLPVTYGEVHEWHGRMGLDRSPLEYISCC